MSENLVPEDIFISISDISDEKLSSEKGQDKDTSRGINIFGRSDTSYGNIDYGDLKKFEIIQEQVKEYRTLLLIDEEDLILYKEIKKWVDENNCDSIENTILKFSPDKYPNSDALAKVIHNYSLPDFIIRYKDELDDDDRPKKQKARENFEILLLRSGLILEREVDTDKIYTYVKVYTPFYALCDVAQQTKLKIRINKEHLPEELALLDDYNRQSGSNFMGLFKYKIDLKKYSMRFRKDHIRKFEGAESEKSIAEVVLNFFNTSRRNLLTYRLIVTANQICKKLEFKDGSAIFVRRKINSLDIKRLIRKGYLDELYPIHDGSTFIEKDPLEMNNLRAQLNKIWVKGRFSRQPMDKIKEYFGEKMALYFAWLGFYTSWLSIASIGGIIVTIYGIIYYSRGSFENYPQKTSAIWDNALTAPYALLMAIWSTCFLETWKRINAAIQYDWDVTDYEKNELPRPEFYGTALRMSLITLKKEVQFPFREKLIKIIISIIIVLISIGIVIVTVGILIKVPLRVKIKYIGPVITAITNLATIIILNLIYRNVAMFLTNFENHKTETQFEDSLILKTYLFDFVNYYSALIYIMIFRDDALCRASCDDGNNAEACSASCIEQSRGLTRLMIQLAIILIGKQLIGQVQEILIPFLMGQWNKAKRKLEKELLEKKYVDSGRKNVPQWVVDDKLAPSTDSIRTEYEEIIIQFGFLSLFGVAFPLAPLFAWINNIGEIRSDALKYIKTLRRPVGYQTQDIGMWEKILTAISYIAALTNAVIIAFHSIWMENQFKKYVGEDEEKLLTARLGFILAFEHFMFLIKLAIAHIIPDIPEKIKNAIERERYFTRLMLDGEPPALDEYWSERNKDDSSLFSEKGSIMLPHKIKSL